MIPTKEVTFGVSTCGNIKALLMCLSSILMARNVPLKIQVRFEGQLPSFADYYLEQLGDLARFRKVQFELSLARSFGIRAARDWQIEHCRTDWLWMGDEDALYDYECLYYFASTFKGNLNQVAFFSGCKYDVNNRRGYQNFDMNIHGPQDLKDECFFNWPWHKEWCADRYAKTVVMDTGNSLIQVPLILKNRIKFQLFEESANSGGEDTLFGLSCRKANLEAYFIPSAQAIHLGQPQLTHFGEHEARLNYVLAVCDLLGLDKQAAKKGLFSWLLDK
jgi:hypothetical protein